jgi:hypothetical protein
MREQWGASVADLRRILAGLTDEEFRWEPCDGSWNVRRDSSAPTGWFMDYPDMVPDPPPVTTIAWRLLHITHGNWIYWEHSFGPGERTFLDLPIYGVADAAVADLIASQRPITDELTAITDVTLGRSVSTPRSVGSAQRQQWPATRVFLTLLREQVHHGAEISLLRDLYRNRTTLNRE